MRNFFIKLNPTIKNKLKNCKLLVMDFDGVMTNNCMFVDSDGRETVLCNRGDGAGIELLSKHTKVASFILSSETNPVVSARAVKLKIPCIHGVGFEGKFEVLKKELKRRKVSPEHVCFVGNDLNDLPCIKHVGLGVAVADSHPKVLENADYVTNATGGHGAVREICELILFAKNSHPHP